MQFHSGNTKTQTNPSIGAEAKSVEIAPAFKPGTRSHEEKNRALAQWQRAFGLKPGSGACSIPKLKLGAKQNQQRIRLLGAGRASLNRGVAPKNCPKTVMPAEVGFQKKQPFMAFRTRGNEAEQKFLDGSVFNTLLPSMFPKRLSGAPNSPPKKSLAFAMPRSIHFIH